MEETAPPTVYNHRIKRCGSTLYAYGGMLAGPAEGIIQTDRTAHETHNQSENLRSMLQLFHLERAMQASKFRRATIGFSLFALAALTAISPARAQQMSTVSKSAEISAFAGYTDINSDYGTRNHGITIGGDYTRFFRFPVVPSLEVRGNYTSGIGITEKSILFGLRLEAPFRRRFHPYGTFLYGGTRVDFKFPPTPTYTYDQASAFSVGGGIDVDVTRNFRAKLDYQQQFEDFGPNGIHNDFTLTPAGFTVGVVYRIPFKPRQGYK